LLDDKDCNFVSYGGNEKEPALTQEHQMSFKKPRDRQRKFLKRTMYSEVNGVLELVYPVEIYDNLSPSESRMLSLTLRQVLCAMKIPL